MKNNSTELNHPLFFELLYATWVPASHQWHHTDPVSTDSARSSASLSPFQSASKALFDRGLISDPVGSSRLEDIVYTRRGTTGMEN